MEDKRRRGAARTQRMPRQERRSQLLRAAHQVFVANGYHGAAMDEIAEAAHVSKPVLYQHFPGKRELYLALLDEHLAALAELVRGAIASTEENRERVRATILVYFEFTAQDSRAHRLVFESDLVNDPDVASRLEDFQAAFAAAIADVVVRDTSLPRPQALLVGRALSGMAQSAARAWLADDGGVPLEEAADLAFRLAWRGIGRLPRDP